MGRLSHRSRVWCENGGFHSVDYERLGTVVYDIVLSYIGTVTRKYEWTFYWGMTRAVLRHNELCNSRCE